MIETFLSSFKFFWCLHASKFNMTRSIPLVLSAWFGCMYVWVYTSVYIWFDACIWYMYTKLEPTRQTMAVNKILKQTASLRSSYFQNVLSIWECVFFLFHRNSLFALTRHRAHFRRITNLMRTSIYWFFSIHSFVEPRSKCFRFEMN